ncbi:efflux RND transporter periplasmic adaptor subunit [Roseobacter sp. HKCCA0434]|uniref:efflux RND transporter periplasmic adaptor subunit n=1 Tax=Roseobacter sp. HKCCA0434 TaxID=3079297 RepID=UPI002905B0BD|nr:HlyD family efflux transporter periplasmic adaptor subunit [Roseobacter sp. HKCCA0434]
MRFILRALIGLFLLCASLGLIGYGVITIAQSRMADEGGGPPRGRGGQERTYTVPVETITLGRAEPRITSYGTVESVRTLELRAPASGVLVDLAADFRNGAEISEGALLFEIDPADARAVRDRAAAVVQEAEAALREARAARDLAEDELGAAISQRELRDAALARQRDLEARGVGTSATTEAAELAASQAEQTVLSRRQAVLTQDAAINRADTTLSRARIDLAEAERRLDDTRFRAPFAGLLADVTAVPGRRVQMNEQLGLLIDPTALEVAFQVTTAQFARMLDDAGRLRPLDVQIGLDAEGMRLDGQLVRSDAQVREGETGRRVFARLTGEGAAVLRPGDFVTVSIAEPPLDDVATVPAAAVTTDDTLLLLDGTGRLEAIAVEVLRRQRDEVILRGPSDGARYVAEARPQLGPGVAVEPLRTAAEVAATAALPDTIALDPDRRARLRAFVEGNPRMPDAVRTRTLAELDEEEVPRATVERIEARMGG